MFMKYHPKYHPEFIESFQNIKNKQSQENVCNKIEEILVTTSNFGEKHYKNLNKPLNQFKRVHVNKSFVIIFKIIPEKKLICFRKYGHHDDIYKKRIID